MRMMEGTINEFYNVFEEELEKNTEIINDEAYIKLLKENEERIKNLFNMLGNHMKEEEAENVVEELVNSFNCITLLRDKYLFSYAYHLGVINGSKIIKYI